MRPFRGLIIISTVTLIALVYVHQQVELVKLSYSIDYKEKVLKDVLDRKESLEYNIANLEDPTRLESILLAKNIDISFPKKDHVFKVAKIITRVKRSTALKTMAVENKGLGTGILEFLGLRAEAQAKER
jgi:hypothetical protein